MWLASLHLTLTQRGLWIDSIHQRLLRAMPAGQICFLGVFRPQLTEEDVEMEMTPWFQWVREVPGVREVARSHFITKSVMNAVPAVGSLCCVGSQCGCVCLQDQWWWLDSLGFLGWRQMASPLRSYLIGASEQGWVSWIEICLTQGWWQSFDLYAWALWLKEESGIHEEICAIATE